MKPTPLLLPFSWLYAAGVAARNLFFDLGLIKITKLPVPVISVGNMRAGGSGKTPFVAMMAKMIRDRGKKVAIVSRGYGRRSSGYVVVSNGHQRCAEAFHAGDEAAQLADLLDGVVVVVDEARSRGAKNVLKSFKVDVIILDDGFQHRFLFRNRDVVLMTAQEILKPSRLLPAGYRREPWSSLKRADVIVVTKCRTRSEFEEASSALQGRWNKQPLGTQNAVAGLFRMFSNERVRSEELRNKNVVALSGIADPGSFEDTISALGARIAQHLRYSDHHWYNERDLKDILHAAGESGTSTVVTTEKDHVRLKAMGEVAERMLSPLSVVVIAIEPSVIEGLEVLEEMLVSL